MGGATSKLDENDWEKADGKLTSGAYTLDGSEPTEAYAVYYLTKKGVNQREFDVTDADKNLLYTTRAVPGTIACFDVLGRSIGEYRLRVYVDIARRYWTVCRFDIPTFAGQKIDQEAKEKLITEIDGNKTLTMPILYKKCLITVSWSRYLAVTALFGPPTAAEMLVPIPPAPAPTSPTSPTMPHYNLLDADDSASSVEDDLFDEASRIAARMRTRTVSEDGVGVGITVPPLSDEKESKEDGGGTTQAEAGDDAQNKETDEPETDEPEADEPETDSKPHMLKIHPSASMPELGQPGPPIDPDEQPTSASAHDTPSALSSPSRATATVGNWLQKQSKTLREQSNSLRRTSQSYLSNTASHKVLHTDPLEGVVQLDQPLILCQEIYNRLIGNHQTSLVSKERVLELLQQDRAQHKAGTDESDSDDKDDQLFSSQGEILPVRVGTDTDLSPGNGVQESKESGDVSDADADGEEHNSNAEQEQEEEQPLVGYWSWDNTLRVHKMKMHLAKGSDLSLHIVLAIIVNQVRYERNAIAMTV
jgi:hypothetical protein